MGDADDIDCNSVIEELYTFLDGELTETRRSLIARHMSDCVDCHEVIEFHAQLKLTIAQKCREDVPDALRYRIAQVLGMPESFRDSGIPPI